MPLDGVYRLYLLSYCNNIIYYEIGDAEPSIIRKQGCKYTLLCDSIQSQTRDSLRSCMRGKAQLSAECFQLRP
jgi:hypothetical protein